MRLSACAALATSTFAALTALVGPVTAAPLAGASAADETDAAAASVAPKGAPTDRASTDRGGDARKEHVRVGVIGGVGFPRPLAIEALVKLERTVSLGLEYSAMPTTRVSGVQLGWHALALDARLFPFQGAFFLGARVARQHLDGSATVDAGAYGAYSGSVAVDTWYVEPRLGFLWTFRSGITVGIDAGVEVPVQKTSTASLPNGVAVPSNVAAARDLFGASTLPTVTLLSVGGMF